MRASLKEDQPEQVQAALYSERLAYENRGAGGCRQTWPPDPCELLVRSFFRELLSPR